MDTYTLKAVPKLSVNLLPELSAIMGKEKQYHDKRKKE